MAAGPRGALKLINWAMAALFVISVGLQLNDPDPVGWMAFYAAGAGACLAAGRHDHAWMAAAVGAVWAALLLPEVAGHIGFTDLFDKMDEKGGRVEIGREVGGLPS